MEEERELDSAQEEAVVIAKEIFKSRWNYLKQEVKETTKKEACEYSFILGFLDYMKIMDKKAEQIEEQLSKNPEEFQEAFKKFEERIKGLEDRGKHENK